MVERKEAAKNTSASEMRETNKWVEHTYNVIATANEILASAVDMETGARGFLLAGQDEFLEPYDSGQKRFSELVASLSITVDDNPAQVELLAQIRTTINNWREKVVEPQIDLRRKIGDAKTMETCDTPQAQSPGRKTRAGPENGQGRMEKGLSSH